MPITTEAMGTGGLRERSLSHSDKVNAGAEPAKCTACPALAGSARQWT
ncbi:MAG: hypothetical protein LLF95_01450 [Bacteroidales bacterium]|nr:hypothetical protein [Bacteroidales bacterium]